MTEIKVSELAEVTSLDDPDLLMAVHLAEGIDGSKKITVANIRSLIIGTLMSAHLAAGDPHTQYILETEKGAVNGVATLDAGGKIPTAQIPAVAITDSFAVASQAAMLALTAERGDVAIRSDLNKTFILQAEPATVLGNWLELKTPTDLVTSVNGQTGVVVIGGGAGTLLDADLLDGQHGAYYQNASNLNAGTVLAARMPALTGDVTTVAGAVATTIGANKVTLAMMAQVATATILGRNTAGTGNVEALSVATAKSLLGISYTGNAYVNLPAVTTGWKRIAQCTSNQGRGMCQVILETTGGSQTPKQLIIYVNKDWYQVGTNSVAGLYTIQAAPDLTYWSGVRLVQEPVGDSCYLEVNFVAASIACAVTVYQKGQFSSWVAAGGEADSGTSSVRASITFTAGATTHKSQAVDIIPGPTIVTGLLTANNKLTTVGDINCTASFTDLTIAKYGLYAVTTYQPTANTAGSNYGFYVIANTSSGSAFNYTDTISAVAGAHISSSHFGTGTIATLTGLYAAATARPGSGVATVVQGGQFLVQNLHTTQAVVTGLGIHVYPPQNAGGNFATYKGIFIAAATVGTTNCIGLDIGAMTGTGAFAIRTAAGKVSIGDTTASTTGATGALLVAGGIGAVGNICSNGYIGHVNGLVTETSGLRVVSPGGGSLHSAVASVTGAIKITLPVGPTNTIVCLKIRVYNYVTNMSFEVHVGGYSYSTGNTWGNSPYACIIGPTATTVNHTVRFGYDGTKMCIYIGELATVWSYPQIFITEVQAGYSAYTTANYGAGYTIGYEATAFANVTATIANTQVGRYLDGILVAKDNAVVHLAGAETITGDKKFNGTFAAGVYSVDILGAAAAARDMLRVGVTSISNGLTIAYNGTTIDYTFRDGTIYISRATGNTLAVSSTQASSDKVTGCATFAGGIGVAAAVNANQIVGLRVPLSATSHVIDAYISTPVTATLYDRILYVGINANNSPYIMFGLYSDDTVFANNYGRIQCGDSSAVRPLLIAAEYVSTSRLVSTVAIGTAPLTVTSTTKVVNLNVDLLDDQDGAYYLAWANLTGVPATFTPSAHTHAAADVTSGVFAVARLGTGTPDGTKFLRDDGTWAVPAGGGAHVLDSATHTISGKTAGQVLLATAATTYAFTTISGDITLTGAGVTAIGTNKVTLAMMAQVATATFLGRTTAATGDVEALTVAQVKTMLNLTGTNSGDQTITLTGNVTGSGTGSFAATIANDAVTNAKLANMTMNTIKGCNDPSLEPADLTVTQVKTMLAYTAADVGAAATVHTHAAADIISGVIAVARLGTGIPDGTKFLRDDGTWVTPSGGGGSPGGSTTQIQYNNAGAFGGITGFTYASGWLTILPFTYGSGANQIGMSDADGDSVLEFRTPILYLPHRTTPGSPNDGYIWTETTGLYAYINGVTVGPFGAGLSGGATNGVAIWSGVAALTYNANFTATVANGALLYNLQSGTSTTTSFATAATFAITYSGASTVGPINCLSATLTSTSVPASANVQTIAGNFTTTLNPSGTTPACNYFGIIGRITNTSVATTPLTAASMHGGQFIAQFSSAATTGVALAKLIGLKVTPTIIMSTSGTNTLTEITGLKIEPGTFSAAATVTTTITNYYGLYIAPVVTSGSGTITITGRYGIYQAADLAATNFFGSRTSITVGTLAVAGVDASGVVTTITHSGNMSVGVYSGMNAVATFSGLISSANASAIGINGKCIIAPTSTGGNGGYTGIYGTAESAAAAYTLSATIDAIRGYINLGFNVGSATTVAPQVSCFIASLKLSGSVSFVNTITTAYFYNSEQLASTNITVTNFYGIYLATPNTGTITNRYGVYSSDAAATNFFNGNLHIGTSGGGKGLRVAEGSNAKMGVATLVAGTVTVNNTNVTANSRIFIDSNTSGGTPGFLRISARTAGTSFTILSSSGTDTSVVAWFIVEPA